jgi:hypothetical protein
MQVTVHVPPLQMSTLQHMVAVCKGESCGCGKWWGSGCNFMFWACRVRPCDGAAFLDFAGNRWKPLPVALRYCMLLVLVHAWCGTSTLRPFLVARC